MRRIPIFISACMLLAATYAGVTAQAQTTTVLSATLTATPQSVTQGSSVLLTWSSQNAASCTSSDFSTGGATSGSVSVSPSSTTMYTVICTNPGSTTTTPGTTTTTAVEHDNAVCTGTYTGYSSPTDSSGYGPGIISNHYLATPMDAYQYAPPGYQSNPTAYCVGLHQTTVGCRTPSSGTCVPNSTWSFRWYNGSGVGAPTTYSSGNTVTYAYEAWTFTQTTTPGTTTTTGGGSVTAQATVTVNAPLPNAPTAMLRATPSTIQNGQSALLHWGSVNATTCTSTDFSTGGAASGSFSVSPATTTPYTVTCTGAGGSAQDTAWVTVTANTKPFVHLTAAPSCAEKTGTNITLSWTSAKVTECTGVGFSTGGATSSSVTVSNVTPGTKFSIICK